MRPARAYRAGAAATAIALVLSGVASSAEGQDAQTLPPLDLATQQACLRLSLKGVSNVSTGFVKNNPSGLFRVAADVRYDNTCTINAPPGPDGGAKRVGLRSIVIHQEQKQPGGHWDGAYPAGTTFKAFGRFVMLQPTDETESGGDPRIDRTDFRTVGSLSTGRLVGRFRTKRCKRGSLIRAAVITRWNSLLPMFSGDPDGPRVGAYVPVHSRAQRCPT